MRGKVGCEVGFEGSLHSRQFIGAMNGLCLGNSVSLGNRNYYFLEVYDW